MTATLALVNPRKRRRKNPSGKRRTAKQRAATRKLVALSRASNPRRRRKARAANPIKYHRRRRKSNPISSHIRRYARRRRRNPIGFSMHGITSMLKAGAIGAGGALAVDLAMGYAPLPSNFVTRTDADGSTNFIYYATKTAFAIGLGTFGKKLLGANAERMAEGAMVVNLYDLFRTLMPAGMRLGYFSPAALASKRNMGAYIPGTKQMGAYVAPVMKLTPRNSMTTGMGGIPGTALQTRGRAFSKS